MSLDHHYLLFSTTPATRDVLTIRKAISDALDLSFGMSFSATYLDILWVDEEGTQCLIRVHKDDATKVSMAMVSWNKSPRLALVKESPFLPSLLSTNAGL